MKAVKYAVNGDLYSTSQNVMSDDVTFDIGKTCHGHNLTTKSQRISQYMPFFMKSTLHNVYFLPTKYYGGKININIDKCVQTRQPSESATGLVKCD